MYVLVAGIPEHTFWNTDIRSAKHDNIHVLDWDSYIKNPRER